LKDFAQLQPFNKKAGGAIARQSTLLPNTKELAHPDMYQNKNALQGSERS